MCEFAKKQAALASSSSKLLGDTGGASMVPSCSVGPSTSTNSLGSTGSIRSTSCNMAELRVADSLSLAPEEIKSLLEASGIATWRIDLRTRLVTGDSNLPSLFGFDASLCRGAPLEQYASAVHKDDCEILKTLVSKVSPSNPSYELEFRVNSKAGYRWMRGIVQVKFDRDASPLAAIGTLREITEEKGVRQTLLEGRAQLSDMLTTALDCIVGMDHRGLVTEWNVAAEKTFGYTRQEAIGSQMSELIIPEEMRQGHHSGLNNYLSTGAGPILRKRLELTAIRKGGERFPVELTVTPVTLADPPAFTGFIRDISKRKRAEAEKEALLVSERSARQEAERANHIKDEFLATLSHEIRTPLNSILGWSQLLKRKPGDFAKASEGLDAIERNARAQAHIVDDLLEMSRIVTGKIHLDMKPIDVMPALRAALQTARPSAEAKSILLESTFEEFPEQVIVGDTNRIQQVFWNLLSNSLKFTPRGGSVQVSVEGSPNEVTIRVRDSGQGIAPEFMPFVFDRFRQADSSTSRRHGGLGLGLSIAKQLVELHGGRIAVTSAGIGQGAEFTVALPLAASQRVLPSPSSASSPKSLPEEQAIAGARLLGIRILAVDDDPDSQLILSRLLGEEEAEVTLASSAAEALAHLEREPFHLLISDIGMPDEDGYALIGKIRNSTNPLISKIPAIALTAFARMDDRNKALHAGFNLHASKPIDSDMIVKMIAEATKTI